MDAADIDLKGFTERFYRSLCSARLGPALETLEYLKHETDVWFEITTLLVPAGNDGRDEIEALSGWVLERLDRTFPCTPRPFTPTGRCGTSRPRRRPPCTWP